MDRIGRIVFALPSWALQRWIASKIGRPIAEGKAWAIGNKVVIFDKTIDD